LFTSEERLEGGNCWNCPCCKKPQQAIKKASFEKLPEVQVIHLKRFIATSEVQDNFRKFEDLVEFPLEDLNMTPYVLKPVSDPSVFLYNLIGVANHYGGMATGHVTAIAMNILDRNFSKIKSKSKSFIFPQPIRYMHFRINIY
jgi:ubiquitin C-terminal hydrolase